MWNGSIAVSLRQAHVISSTYWFSGSNADGTLNQRNCGDWTRLQMSAGGRAGRRVKTDAGWISQGNNHCNNPSQLVCVCTVSATDAPSAAPFSAPSASPVITPLVLYDIQPRHVENRAGTTARCAASPFYSIYNCARTVALLW